MLIATMLNWQTDRPNSIFKSTGKNHSASNSDQSLLTTSSIFLKVNHNPNILITNKYSKVTCDLIDVEFKCVGTFKNNKTLEEGFTFQGILKVSINK